MFVDPGSLHLANVLHRQFLLLGRRSGREASCYLIVTEGVVRWHQHLQTRKIGSEQGEDQRRLRDLAGVGAAVEADLRILEVRSVSELAASDGDGLYNQLCDIKGNRQDPC